MPKFFIPSKNVTDDQVTITGNDVHHIGHVLRKRAGDTVIIVTNEEKTEYRARIKNITPSKIRLQILERIPASFDTTHPIILVQGIPKHRKMDFIIQKATELGVEEIIPLISRYSFRNSKGTISQTRRDRWYKICHEAAKQCGRRNIPLLHPPTEFQALVDRFEKEPNLLRLLLWEKENQNQLKNVLRQQKKITKIIILIGPEGSFSAAEIQSAIECKFIPVCCGPWVMRCETAAIYALSVIQYEFNFSKDNALIKT